MQQKTADVDEKSQEESTRALKSHVTSSGHSPGASSLTGMVIDGPTFMVGRKLGSGAYRIMRVGKNIYTNDEVMIKMEPRNIRSPSLRQEHKIYMSLGSHEGFPEIYHFGRCGKFNVMVMELLGPSLEDLFQECGKRFTLKTVLMIAMQVLQIIKYIHEKDLIYGDIKPENFLVGRGSKDKIIYIVDFELARLYIDLETKKHIPYREHLQLTGTPRYMSINNHMGIEQTRRDDLEAIGHMLMYFLRGSLPWQGLQATRSGQRYKLIAESKKDTPIEVLCEGFPELIRYMKYVRGLGFSETPNYDYLRDLFSSFFVREGFKNDGKFDWSIGKTLKTGKFHPSPTQGSAVKSDDELLKAMGQPSKFAIKQGSSSTAESLTANNSKTSAVPIAVAGQESDLDGMKCCFFFKRKKKTGGRCRWLW